LVSYCIISLGLTSQEARLVPGSGKSSGIFLSVSFRQAKAARVVFMLVARDISPGHLILYCLGNLDESRPGDVAQLLLNWTLKKEVLARLMYLKVNFLSARDIFVRFEVHLINLSLDATTGCRGLDYGDFVQSDARCGNDILFQYNHWWQRARIFRCVSLPADK
jgi:hypothetical protein